MSFDLGVWCSDEPLTDEDAGDLYVNLCEQKWIPIGENAAVDAFYKELPNRYPEIDTVPEEGLENCPWSCAHNRSELHVLIAMTWSSSAEIAPVVLALAAKHGLVCYDPQESKVHLPSQLKPRPSRLRSWWHGIRMVVTGVGFIAIADLRGSAQELDPHDPSLIAYRLERASAVVVGKFQKDWCLPWLDGWHCSGAVHITESLYGGWKPSEAVQFRWKERYGNSCLVCEKVSQFDGHKGIWFLTKKNDTWQFTSTGALWCGGPFPMDEQDAVIRLVRQRDRK